MERAERDRIAAYHSRDNSNLLRLRLTVNLSTENIFLSLIKLLTPLFIYLPLLLAGSYKLFHEGETIPASGRSYNSPIRESTLRRSNFRFVLPIGHCNHISSPRILK